MALLMCFKNSVLLLFLLFLGCGKTTNGKGTIAPEPLQEETPIKRDPIVVGANRTNTYLPLLQHKKVAVVANQTSVIFKKYKVGSHTHLVDSLLSLNIDIKKVFAPEHGFRGQADAGEKVMDGIDSRTGLPILSLHGKSRKPSPGQLKDIEVVLFDIQDVGVRFYTYIATLQLVMEACAENDIPLIVLDRPNPNGHYIDGPTMKREHVGFLGMNEIPLVYGMTIGEYAQMVNGEGWLPNGDRAQLTVIPLESYDHQKPYSLPIRPSPNLPNDVAINLYPSLGLFEGTNVNAGRGTEFQFQRYGASFLDSTQYSFAYVPHPNFGSKSPKENGKRCFGEDLHEHPRINEVSLQWLINAYQNATDTSLFFNTQNFTKHAGTEILQQQLKAGHSEATIRDSWKKDLEKFKKIREKYLIY
ncbi:MAG: exo-beta-N-acetylmuramidase NamZ domain-containing protein [Flavobacteriaceae bacterium]